MFKNDTVDGILKVVLTRKGKTILLRKGTFMSFHKGHDKIKILYGGGGGGGYGAEEKFVN